MAARSSLARYRAKRDFTTTPEPADGGKSIAGALQFVVQKHWATRLHYDFRLELDGTMKSWAVPKGPSYDTADKRMAIHVEDHPIAYNRFEGQIPEKQYGAGKVIIWDRGIWVPLEDPRSGYARGMLKFTLHGYKLFGAWALIRMRSREPRQDAWLLIKETDEYVRPAAEFSVVDEFPDSVAHLPETAKKGVKRRKAPAARPSRAKQAKKPKKAKKTKKAKSRRA
jgi:bifunctional non-homologous end joining protein LigD